MNHICYFYIFDYRSIHNMGIGLDARYTYEMDEDERMLTIERNENYVEGFWPEGISSLSAIVGGNGTGKTTFLESMLTVLSGGRGEGVVKVIVVYEEGNRKLKAYKPDDNYQILFDGKPVEESMLAPKVPNVTPFYYSSAFRPYSKIHIPGDGAIGNAYNATDTWRLIKDLQEYANVKGKDKDVILDDYFDAYKAQDNSRIVQLVCDKAMRQLLPSSALPRYVLINPNVSGYKREQTSRMRLYLGPNSTTLGQGNTKAWFMDRIIDNILTNIMSETAKRSRNIVESIRDKWERMFDGSQDIIEALEYIKQHTPSFKEHIEDTQKVVKFLMESCTYNEDTDTMYIDIEAPENKEKIRKLIEFYQGSDFKVARYFDLQYSRDIEGKTQLSAGELDMLKLCSRLYDAALLQPKRRGAEIPQLILIDEAENSYHPEWQRQFVHMFLNFVQALYEKIEHRKEFQIVLTTHSPILLSDIPRIYINYLERDKNGKVTLSMNQPETFGANVFELYRHAFFMNEGLVGEYARTKIKKLQNDIKRGKKSKSLMQEIEMIGDEKIRAYLYAMMEKRHPKDMISYYEDRLKALKMK